MDSQPIKTVIFWHNAPPVHQYALLRAIANLGRYKVVLVTSKDLLDHRRRMGWTEPDFGSVVRVHRPDPYAVKKLLDEHDVPDTLHVFSGIHAFPRVYAAFRAALRTSARIGIIAIQPDPRGIRGVLRQLLYAAHAIRYGRRIHLFLALGEGGAHWYRSVGFPSGRVYAFGNFTEPPSRIVAASPRLEQRFRMLFLGELLERKSVDVLLQAVSGLDKGSWQLDIVGDGPVRTRLETLARSLSIEENIRWMAFQPHDTVLSLLANADLLVLPSTFDGWGAVVNEALMCGVPVVCSNECGAADIASASLRSAVFRAGNVAALREALGKQIRRGMPTASERRQLAAWAACVSPQRGAEYFRQILLSAFEAAPRPRPPWVADGAVRSSSQ